MPIKKPRNGKPLIDLRLFFCVFYEHEKHLSFVLKSRGVFDHHMFGFLFWRQIVKKYSTII